MRVLLSGENGNFGQEFVRQTHHDVVSLNRTSWGHLDDIISEIDIVIHAASDLHTKIEDSPTAVLDSNIMSTARLLEAIYKNGIKRFVFMSSCAVYGESMRTSETSPCHATSINGIGKLLNEMAITEFCSQNGIEFEILRVFNMYGGNDNFSILSHIRRALNGGTPFILNNRGIAQRDFIHVSDVVAIVHSIIEKQVPFSHINIGTGISTRISTLVDLVMERFPELLIKQAQLDEAEYSRADISRLLSLTNRKFIRIEDYLRTDFAVTD